MVDAFRRITVAPACRLWTMQDGALFSAGARFYHHPGTLSAALARALSVPTSALDAARRTDRPLSEGLYVLGAWEDAGLVTEAVDGAAAPTPDMLLSLRGRASVVFTPSLADPVLGGH